MARVQDLAAHRYRAMEELDSSASGASITSANDGHGANSSAEDDMSLSEAELDQSGNDHDPLDDVSDGEIDPSDISEDDVAQQPSYASAIRQIPFSDLAEAQTSLPSSKRPSHTPRSAHHTSSLSQQEPSEKLQALRDRLADLRAQKRKSKAKDRNQKAHNDDSGSGSDGEEGPHSRSSKHAPAEQTSKRPITRKRIITEVSNNPTHARDPRFSAASGYIDPTTVARRYAFLSTYRDGEIKELKEAVKKARDPEEKAKLRVAAGRMENRARVEKQREKEAEVRRQHKKEEREKVKQGKKPYFLKKGEVKKQVLVDKFEGMSGKDRERLVKRRKQKEAQREKRSMPGERRVQ
ncbi:hypothetical protein FH972_024906 [Carpinus fangiana]|uniref:rRNA biogenesis protein RRP36 n=1 Tax=Carpinus fangiana TaxID=176857 RepID=A0A5N6KZH2_9ROSI|nr:hypothetical protein FH972_024906 [Carpinus fangiana]